MKYMKRMLIRGASRAWLWLLGASLSTASLASETQGFDAPESTSKAPLGFSMDVHPPMPKNQSCAVYPEFAVVAVNDPAVMGEIITIRPRKGEPALSLCDKDHEKGARELDKAYGRPWGVAGHYVFVEAPDDFGVATDFAVFDATTGKEMWNGTHHNGKPVTLKKEGGKTSMSFYAVLKAYDCPKDSETCWQKYLEESELAAKKDAPSAPQNTAKKAALDLKKPTCTGTTGPWQVAVPVVVTDIVKGGMTGVSGEATCDLMP